MDPETSFQKALEILKPWTRWSKASRPDLLTVSVSRGDLLECIAALLKAKWGYLSAITGLHLPGVENTASVEKQWNRLSGESSMHALPPALGDSFVVLYHFCQGSATLNLRVHPPSLMDADIPSICGLIPSATLYERELIEMFGIRITGTPDTEHLLLPDDWPPDVYPLRKSFTGLEPAAEGK